MKKHCTHLNNHTTKTLLIIYIKRQQQKQEHSTHPSKNIRLPTSNTVSSADFFFLFFKFASHAKMNITKEYIFKQTNIKVLDKWKIESFCWMVMSIGLFIYLFIYFTSTPIFLFFFFFIISPSANIFFIQLWRRSNLFAKRNGERILSKSFPLFHSPSLLYIPPKHIFSYFCSISSPYTTNTYIFPDEPLTKLFLSLSCPAKDGVRFSWRNGTITNKNFLMCK